MATVCETTRQVVLVRLESPKRRRRRRRKKRDEWEIRSLLSGASPAAWRLSRLRKTICEKGLKPESKQRHLVWKLMLGVGRVDAAHYAGLVSRGATSADAAIRNDARRTFRSDGRARRRVRDEQIARVLNALRHHSDETTEISGANRCPVCATFLFVMSELETFYSLLALRRRCPTYFATDLHGVCAGAQLVASCLAVVDKQLFDRLIINPNGDSKLFEDLCAFPLLASFFSCAPPLKEVLALWDVLFAVGPHFAVFACLALCVSQRDRLLAARNPLTLLQQRNLPPLDARALAHKALDLVPAIPDPLYALVLQHPTTRVHRREITHWRAPP
ncbi:hypothetical protein CTAYLR_002991 [Chrysophaeum taylorii]|uniref:Rab-GAP TBC domain-containing protein n=1 Tax=Chrysophaeum taylorii TaxID=2483200 RepID=A0AAD7U525_9STRA|nr:hypothetical protein CTAYLR_002991 [Chrysophaeum taylorii]